MLMEFSDVFRGEGVCVSYGPIPVEMSSVQSHVGTCRGHLSRRAEYTAFVSCDQGLSSSGEPRDRLQPLT